MSRVYNFFSGSGSITGRSIERSSRRDVRLQRNRHVRDGDEPPFQSI